MDYMACRLIERLDALGLRVPEDVSVIGFDHFVGTGQPPTKKLATFEQPGRAVGRRGAEKLLRRAADPNATQSVELIMPKWIAGKTLAAPPK